MDKLSVLAKTVFLAILVGAVYGILNDYISYTISPEYYTRFKFTQNNFDPNSYTEAWLAAIVVGFKESWWIGLVTGIIVGFFGMIFTKQKNMQAATVFALVIIFSTAGLAEIIGILWSKYYSAKINTFSNVPPEVFDKENFTVVESMRNFGEIGALVGLAIAILFMFRYKYVLSNKPSNDLAKEW
jgi:hypothetical protein